MITRGYFVGQIIDELAGIAAQVDTRCRLGLTDLNRHLEDFSRDILNIIFEIDLINLNSERSNEPGLDLGDQANAIAFQVTSQKTSAKINATLATLSAQQIGIFTNIFVLIFGYKQRDYSLDSALCEKCHFMQQNILDIDDICMKAMGLKLDQLQSLHKLVISGVARVKIELEIPDSEGDYPTSMNDYIEAVAKVRLSDFSKLHEYACETVDSSDAYKLEEIQTGFLKFSNDLAHLPRITREFYAFLIERRDVRGNDSTDNRGFSFNDDRLRRLCRYSDLDGELRLLQERNLVVLREPNERGESAYWWTRFPGLPEYLHNEFVGYLDSKKISFKTTLVNLDFSDL